MSLPPNQNQYVHVCIDCIWNTKQWVVNTSNKSEQLREQSVVFKTSVKRARALRMTE